MQSFFHYSVLEGTDFRASADGRRRALFSAAASGISSCSFTAKFFQQSRFHDFFIRREDFTQKSVPRRGSADRVLLNCFLSRNFTAKFSIFCNSSFLIQNL